MLTFLRSFALAIVSLVVFAPAANAFDVDFDRTGAYLLIDLDESHDLCMIATQNNRIRISVLQFDPAEFAEVPDPFLYEEDVLRSAAENVRDREFDAEDVLAIIVTAYDGHDLIWADQSFNGYLVAYGDQGNDTLIGGSAPNFLFGGEGEDLLSGGPWRDRLDGGAGDDQLYGQGYDDRLDGGLGDDDLFGGAGNDELNGDDGNDLLRGGSGADDLYGDGGEDDLDGGYDGSVDALYGGPDADTFTYRRYRNVESTTAPKTRYYSGSALSRTFNSLYSSSTVTFTTQTSVEIDSVEDFNSDEGDQRKSIRVD